MVADSVSILGQALEAVLDWFTRTINAVQGSGIIAAAFLIVAVVSLLILPLRGAGIGSIKEFAASPVNKHNGNKKSGGSNKKSGGSKGGSK